MCDVVKRAAAYLECDSASVTRGPLQKDQNMLVLTSLLCSVLHSGFDRIDLGLPLRSSAKTSQKQDAGCQHALCFLYNTPLQQHTGSLLL